MHHSVNEVKSQFFVNWNCLLTWENIVNEVLQNLSQCSNINRLIITQQSEYRLYFFILLLLKLFKSLLTLNDFKSNVTISFTKCDMHEIFQSYTCKVKICELDDENISFSISFSYQYVHEFQIPMSETIVVKVVENW